MNLNTQIGWKGHILVQSRCIKSLTDEKGEAEGWLKVERGETMCAIRVNPLQGTRGPGGPVEDDKVCYNKRAQLHHPCHSRAGSNVTTNDTSYTNSDVQHLPWRTNQLRLGATAHNLPTIPIERHPQLEDLVNWVANVTGYYAIIFTERLGSTIVDGRVGCITLGVNKSTSSIPTAGREVKVWGYLPTVSLISSA